MMMRRFQGNIPQFPMPYENPATIVVPKWLRVKLNGVRLSNKMTWRRFLHVLLYKAQKYDEIIKRIREKKRGLK